MEENQSKTETVDNSYTRRGIARAGKRNPLQRLAGAQREIQEHARAKESRIGCGPGFLFLDSSSLFAIQYIGVVSLSCIDIGVKGGRDRGRR